MSATVTLPIWLFVLILLFAGVTFASHFLFPSVRWFFRRRLERAVTRLNTRLKRPIEPFKLARRYDMIQRLSYDPQVTEAIVEHARENGVPENVAFEQAQRYAREIVPGFSTSLYFGFAIKLAKLISRSLYHVRISDERQNALEGVDKDAAVVFVMNHRSNMDYFLVTYLVARESAMAYAVGEWARVWPLSWLVRALGAYFIRRKSRNALYRRVLARYVRLATEAGVTQAMFPEGGLSLDGGLAPAKMGLLKYITDGFDPDTRDIVFVPVAINYDRVLEDRILIAADESGTRRFKARISVIAGFVLKQLLLWVTFQYRRFGTAAVGYGAPLSLAEFVGGRPDAGQAEGLTEELAQELMRRIGQAVPIVPVPLVARAIAERGPISRANLIEVLRSDLAHMGRVGRALPDQSVERGAEVALKHLLGRRILRETGGLLQVTPGQENALAYYANSLRHLPGPIAAGAK